MLTYLTLTEKIPAESLNKLFSQTVIFYFSMQRSAAANVFNTFFKYDPKATITFDGAINKLYDSLGKEREKFAAKRKVQYFQIRKLLNKTFKINLYARFPNPYYYP